MAKLEPALPVPVPLQANIVLPATDIELAPVHTNEAADEEVHERDGSHRACDIIFGRDQGE
eukprot:7062470-Prorocentrum_lima.AAC.1